MRLLVLLRPLMLHIPGPDTRHVAVRAAAPHQAAHQAIDHSADGARNGFEAFADRTADGAEGGFNFVAGCVTVRGEKRAWEVGRSQFWRSLFFGYFYLFY